MKRILVGVDGSKYSLEAVKAAAKLASERNIEAVTLIHVIPIVVSTIAPCSVLVVRPGLENNK